MVPSLLSKCRRGNYFLAASRRRVGAEMKNSGTPAARTNTRIPKGMVTVLAPIFCMLAISTSSFAQDFNPPFPRIGVIYFYEANIPEEVWRYHDLIVTRLWYPEIARRVKQAYPNKLVIACNNIIDGNTLQPPEAWLVPTLNNSCIKGWHDNSHPGDCLYDGTDRCPLVNGERWNTYLAKKLNEKTDWAVFDGTFWDSWAGGFGEWKENYNQIDLNRNGIADASESKTLVNELWQESNRRIVEELRKLAPPGKIVMAHEADAAEIGYLNGIGMEGWTGEYWDWKFTGTLLPFADNAVTPRVNFIECKAKPYDFQRMRFGLATACLAGAYFGVDEGAYAHRFTYVYDEYLADLGYPTSAPQKIKPGVWVRYFDKGAVIANGSGAQQTVTAAELEGGPYYHFLGGQAPQINNGQAFTSVALAGSADNTKEQTGDGVLLLKEPGKILIIESVVDNAPLNMTSAGNEPAVFTGNWTEQDPGKVSKTNAYALNYGWVGNEDGYDNHHYPYLFTAANPNGGSEAVYTPTLGVAGEYEVFEWHPFHGNSANEAQEATNVSYAIKHRNGVTQKVVDQSQNHGRWNSLGVYSFDAGTNGKVTISNKAASGVVLADAIKFVNVKSEIPPPPPVVDTTPPAAPTGVKVQVTQ